MRLSEIAPTKPKTPAELHVDALKRSADHATAHLKAERHRHRIARANKELARLRASSLGGDDTDLTT